MNAWPRITVRALRSVLSPRIGRSRALRRAWSDSIRLLAYWSVTCYAPGTASVIARANAQALSVVISAGSPWVSIASVKNR